VHFFFFFFTPPQQDALFGFVHRQTVLHQRVYRLCQIVVTTVTTRSPCTEARPFSPVMLQRPDRMALRVSSELRQGRLGNRS